MVQLKYIWIRLSFVFLSFSFSLLFSSTFSHTFLTTEEQQWIVEHPTINACVEGDWAPFSYVSSKGEVVGLSKDYSDKVVENVNLKIKYHVYNKWEKILDDTKMGKCDLLNGLYYTPEREKFIHYTIPYLHMKEYFFVKSDAPAIESMEDLKHKKVALVKGYAITEWVKTFYPSITILEKETISECLYSVSTGESDAFIGDTPSARYNMEKNFISGIVITGINKDRTLRELRMGVKKSYPMLEKILSKSIRNLSENEQKEIREKWMSQLQPKTNWLLIGLIFSAILLITFIFMIFNWRLRKLVKIKTEALEKFNHELESKVKARTEELHHLNGKLQLAANTDPMTGIYNRRYFFDVSAQILEVSKRDNMPMSIAMLDIDKFKIINDTYGHDVGDIVIQKSVELIRVHLKEDDILIRFGGEEFLVVMLDTSIKDALNLCEKIRQSIEKSYPINEERQVTISIGISHYSNGDTEIDQIVKRADNALYEAKRTGRNKIKIEEA
jgi:diguanylate cyclase (GGDEF)-like protein